MNMYVIVVLKHDGSHITATVDLLDEVDLACFDIAKDGTLRLGRKGDGYMEVAYAFIQHDVMEDLLFDRFPTGYRISSSELRALVLSTRKRNNSDK